MEYIVVFVTASSEEEAQKIAHNLLQNKLVACANIMPGIKSIYWWQGKIDQSAECLLVLKTQKKLFSKLAKAVKALHSYDLPEIIAFPIVEGDNNYLQWISKETA